jgi:hypothetical protein
VQIATNYARLKYLSDNFVCVKLSSQDTPSRFDIDNGDIDDNRDYWKTHAIEPFWDCYIGTDNEHWTFIHTEFYFPRNGQNPIGEKHSHDFEEINFFYMDNETVPRFVSFPTFTGFTDHPHIILEWYNVPQSGDKYLLRLDSSTNAFAENYDVFPDPNQNYKPTLVSANFTDLTDYLSTLETTIIYSSLIGIGIIFVYITSQNKFRHKYFLLLFLLSLFVLYPILTLQYDFVQGASFRVWQNNEKPNTEMWYSSTEGQSYISEYGGLPFDRDRWTEPSFALGGM